MSHTPIKTAVFPVAGLGTRFLPATKVVPKELLPVLDKPLIQYAVEECLSAGIERFVFVISKGKESIRDHFVSNPTLESTLEARGRHEDLELVRSVNLDPDQVKLSYQDEPKGLGHAVLCAKDHIPENEPFVVILPDDFIISKTPCIQQMIAAYSTAPGNFLASLNVPQQDTCKYGILELEDATSDLPKVTGMVEKPRPEVAPSTLAIIGRYVLEYPIFSYLESQETGAGGEIQLTDAMQRMLTTHTYSAFSFEGTRYDCGSKSGMLSAQNAMMAWLEQA